MRQLSMKRVEAANRKKGHYWFGAATMRFFDSRVEGDYAYGAPGEGPLYFVSSERFSDSTVRLYSVRTFDPLTGVVDTHGEFRAYESKEEAYMAVGALIGQSALAETEGESHDV